MKTKYSIVLVAYTFWVSLKQQEPRDRVIRALVQTHRPANKNWISCRYSAYSTSRPNPIFEASGKPFVS